MKCQMWLNYPVIGHITNLKADLNPPTPTSTQTYHDKVLHEYIQVLTACTEYYMCVSHIIQLFFF